MFIWTRRQPAATTPPMPGRDELGDVHPDDQLTVARPIPTRLITLCGRVVNRSGRHTLRPHPMGQHLP